MPEKKDTVALIWEGDEPGDDKKITYGEMKDEVCRLAKSEDAIKQIPIIFLTAQPQPAAVAKAMSLGAAGYLVKPFDPMKIIDQINESLVRVQAPTLKVA